MRFFKDDDDEFVPFDEYDGGMMSHHFYQQDYEYRQGQKREQQRPLLSKCRCGYNPNPDWLDCVRKVNRWSEATRIVCPEHNCGCGVWVQGDTLQHAVDNWNNQRYEKPEDY